MSHNHITFENCKKIPNISHLKIILHLFVLHKVIMFNIRKSFGFAKWLGDWFFFLFFFHSGIYWKVSPLILKIHHCLQFFALWLYSFICFQKQAKERIEASRQIILYFLRNLNGFLRKMRKCSLFRNKSAKIKGYSINRKIDHIKRLILTQNCCRGSVPPDFDNTSNW